MPNQAHMPVIARSKDIDSAMRGDRWDAPKELLAQQRWRMNNLYSIVDVHGQVIDFQMNWAQLDYFNRMHYNGVILKARQLGFSTFIELLILDMALWRKNFQATIIAHGKEEASKLFSSKILFAYNQLPDATYKQALTHMSDLTYEEFLAKYANEQTEDSSEVSEAAETVETFDYCPVSKDEDTVDWARKGLTPQVVSQGKCGSCYIFSAVAHLESQFLKLGLKQRLSQQAPINCPNQFASKMKGCNGGHKQVAMQWYQKYGLVTLDSVPCLAKAQSCNSSSFKYYKKGKIT